MRTSIHSHPAYSTLIADLTQGEAIKAEPGAMVAQQNVTLATGASGGMFKGLNRMLGGESFFLNTFTANNGLVVSHVRNRRDRAGGVSFWRPEC